jgi:SAM-dependent methyltransferase
LVNLKKSIFCSIATIPHVLQPQFWQLLLFWLCAANALYLHRMQRQKEWFSEWFDSPYYHILYQHRDEDEARFFLNNLVKRLGMHPGLHLIDLACGRGRHAIYLNKLGLEVTGVDLSQASIEAALGHTNDRLHFLVQDLRYLNLNKQFDIALNLFTSFGYFQHRDEDLQVLKGIHGLLKPQGLLVIDFFNQYKVLQQLVPHEQKRIGEIEFDIKRWHNDQFLFKQIGLKDGDNRFEYIEQVQLLNHDIFSDMLHESGFAINQVYGDYSLNQYNQHASDRLILVAQKI